TIQFALTTGPDLPGARIQSNSFGCGDSSPARERPLLLYLTTHGNGDTHLPAPRHRPLRRFATLDSTQVFYPPFATPTDQSCASICLFWSPSSSLPSPAPPPARRSPANAR
ncbi:unnamed protein product, partial [Mycena citricolor]